MNEFNDITPELTNNLKIAREFMKNNKPRAYKKLMTFLENQRNDVIPRVSLLDWGYDFQCNFRCVHCGTKYLGNHNVKNMDIPKKMPMDIVKKVADEADELGYFVISFIGGEPLLWKELDDLVKTVDPSRFYITVLTNGWLLSETKAKHLYEIGVNKVGISIDSGFANEHDSFRQKKDSFNRAMEGIYNSINAGLRVHISTTITHQNLKSEGINKLLEISKQLQLSIDLQCATVAGCWQNNFTVLIDEEDANYILDLRKKYPLIRRDIFPTPDGTGGCPAYTGSVFLTSSGEIIPCLFIHISLGNIYKDSFKTILERGSMIPELVMKSDKCLAGEDKIFIDKYLTKTFNVKNLPLSFESGFFSSIESKRKDNDAQPSKQS